MPPGLTPWPESPSGAMLEPQNVHTAKGFARREIAQLIANQERRALKRLTRTKGPQKQQSQTFS